MRILFVDHPQFTSGSYLLWHGLNEVLPPGSVTCYPHLPTHYDADSMDLDGLAWFGEMAAQVRRGELPPGIPPFAPGEELTGGAQKVIRRYEASRRFSPPEQLPSEASVVSDIESGRFSLIVLANSHRVPTIALGRLRQKTRSLPPIVYYDAGERDELNEHWIHVFRPSLVFKQILTPAVVARGLTVPTAGYQLRILPLPLSSPLVDSDDPLPVGVPLGWLRMNDGPLDKIFDVFYSMGPTWPGRASVLSMLDALCRNTGAATTGLVTYKNYHLVLSRSRMAVTMRGSGRDTQRYWEIPLYRTLMVADGTMGCLHPFPFEDEKTAVFYRSMDELREKVTRYIPRNGPVENERHAISCAGREHLWRYHSTGARAVFFLDRVMEHAGVADEASKNAVDRWKNERRWRSDWRGPVAKAD